MNELQQGMLNEFVAVSISTKEDFDKVINFLSINNCFLSNGEPVIKLPYPGNQPITILIQDKIVYWQTATQAIDPRYKVVNTIEFFRPVQEEKVIEAKAEIIDEQVSIDEKHLSLEVQKRPANEAIVSNIDDKATIRTLLKKEKEWFLCIVLMQRI